MKDREREILLKELMDARRKYMMEKKEDGCLRVMIPWGIIAFIFCLGLWILIWSL